MTPKCLPLTRNHEVWSLIFCRALGKPGWKLAGKNLMFYYVPILKVASMTIYLSAIICNLVSWAMKVHHSTVNYRISLAKPRPRSKPWSWSDIWKEGGLWFSLEKVVETIPIPILMGKMVGSPLSIWRQEAQIIFIYEGPKLLKRRCGHVDVCRSGTLELCSICSKDNVHIWGMSKLQCIFSRT